MDCDTARVEVELIILIIKKCREKLPVSCEVALQQTDSKKYGSEQEARFVVYTQ